MFVVVPLSAFVQNRKVLRDFGRKTFVLDLVIAKNPCSQGLG